MRDIKFSILLQHDETGRIVERVFSYADIFNGTAKAELGKLKGYAVIARREYAGLTDKHGKEIYEGDIVRLPNTDMCHIEYKSTMFIATSITKKFHGCSKYIYWHNDSEIIGNIYENPELMMEGNPHA